MPVASLQNKPVGGIHYIHRISLVVLIFSTVQMSLGAGIYAGVTNSYLGDWWAGVLGIITAICGFMIKTNWMLLTTCIVSVLAIVAGVIGCFLDGIGNQIVSNLSACVHGPHTKASAMAYPGIGLKYAGNSEDYLAAYTCYQNYLGHHDPCICVNRGSSVCYFYQGPTPESSCSQLMDVWAPAVLAVVIFDVVCTVLLIVLSITICSSIFCPSVFGSYQLASIPAHSTANNEFNSLNRDVANVDGDEQLFLNRSALYRSPSQRSPSLNRVPTAMGADISDNAGSPQRRSTSFRSTSGNIRGADRSASAGTGQQYGFRTPQNPTPYEDGASSEPIPPEEVHL